VSDIFINKFFHSNTQILTTFPLTNNMLSF